MSDDNKTMTETSKPIRILSLGAGVQSTTLLLMSIRGELPRIDHAVFADTKWEPAAVYDHLAWLEDESRAAGIPLTRVHYRDLRADLIEFRISGKSGNGYTHVPLYTLNGGDRGMLMRTCTEKYKIGPVYRFVRETYSPTPDQPIDVWMGITWDENNRMKMSRDRWKRHVYPFCGAYGDNLLPQLWTRDKCLRWLAENYPERDVPRSSCIGCPYHSNAEWRRIRANEAEWADAVEVDEAIRAQASPGFDGTPYLHRDCVPLAEADLSDDRDGDPTLFGFAGECEGMCGV